MILVTLKYFKIVPDMEARQQPSQEDSVRRQRVAEMVEELSQLTRTPNQQQTTLRVRQMPEVELLRDPV